MKAKLLVSTAFLAASVSLSAQKSATITVHADRRKSTVNLPNTWVHVSTVVFG